MSIQQNSDPFVNRVEYASFFKNAFTWNGSITPKVLLGTTFSMIYCLCIAIIHLKNPDLDIDIGPFEYSGVVLGLLLVFRINSGYERWWEARKLWGGVVNQSRNLATIGLSYSVAPDVWRSQFSALIALFCHAAKDSLRSQESAETIRGLAGTAATEEFTKLPESPLLISVKISKLLCEARRNGWIDSFSFLQAEIERKSLVDSFGACERILKTPMPFVLVVKLKRFVFLFLVILPFALESKLGLVAPILDALITYSLLSLDQIGYELQNPFSRERISHLPLDEICKTIEFNVDQIKNLTEIDKDIRDGINFSMDNLDFLEGTQVSHGVARMAETLRT
jgi:putative membrane protein